MKRKKVESHVEKQIIIALITCKEFLAQASLIVDPADIDVPHIHRIVTWCLEHYAKYGTAPGTDIETTFSAWEETAKDKQLKAEADAIADLLEHLSDISEDSFNNIPYLLDQLRAYIEGKKLQKLQDDLDFALSTGHQEDAARAILGFRPVEITSGTGLDPLRDKEAWMRAFSEVSDPLIEFPGDAGTFLNHALTRDSLIGIQGPEKRGKTFWCIEFVMQALKNRRKVAFFQVGDLSEHQVLIRLGMYIARRPSLKKYCGTIRVPRRIIPPRQADEEVEVEREPREFRRRLTPAGCIRACEKFFRTNGISGKNAYLKVSIHANSSINVRGIAGMLDIWEMVEGFIPDVIVIDYADILAPEDARLEPRERINETWKALRRLSQERKCLVIAPTQANADSYDKFTQSMKNFSEDKRKLAHVTGMLGLNQTPEEKEKNLMRLNWIVLRESPFNHNHCLWVGQCLPIGRAYYCSAL